MFADLRETEKKGKKVRTPLPRGGWWFSYFCISFRILGMYAHILGMFLKPLCLVLDPHVQPRGIWWP